MKAYILINYTNYKIKYKLLFKLSKHYNSHVAYMYCSSICI